MSENLHVRLGALEGYRVLGIWSATKEETGFIVRKRYPHPVIARRQMFFLGPAEGAKANDSA